jgi:excinuclease ABC subunit C
LSSVEKQEFRSRLLEEAKQAKTTSGVYLMKGETGEVLYIGKAKNLKNRVTTYFQGQIHELPRVEMLVTRVRSFDVILTETEEEALILEATLVKKYKPRFNVRLKDDKAYPYLKIRLDEDFPRIEWTRRVEKDRARYFGPFPSAWSARQVLVLLNETFRLRDCSDNAFRHRSRPCILFQMNRCTAPCVGEISQRDYQGSIKEVISVLSGKTQEIVRDLRAKMTLAAENEEFEIAADYRDQMKNLELITATQSIQEAGVHRDRDVVALAMNESDAQGTVLKVRNGIVVGVHHYHLQNSDLSLSEQEIWEDFLVQYYMSSKEDRPEEVLLPIVLEEENLAESTLNIAFTHPKSDVDRQLVGVAFNNAEYALEQRRKKSIGHGLLAMEEVQEKLNLSGLPYRIECYDISNIQGDEAVASRVVFIDGSADKSLYRRYKIKTVVGPNDYAMMKEVLSRRFLNQTEALPNLVVVDGGKGQLAQVVAVLEELAVQGVAVAALAKARTEKDFKATEVKSTMERVFIPNRKNPINLLPHTGAFKLLTHVRDEAHRFAIAYHRLLRSKKAIKKK